MHPRIFLPDLPIEGEIIIAGENYFHLARSMRAKTGDNFKLFNGNGLFASAVIDEITKSQVKAHIIESSEIDNTPAIKLTLAFGLLPPTPLGTLLSGATQLGANSFRPFMSTYNDIRIKPDESHRVMGRWRKIIIENAAVSGRSHLPEISAPSKLEDCMGDSKKFDFRFVFWEEGGYPVWEMPQIDKGEIIVVIGPKGGLSPDEINLLKKKEFKVLSLGGFILKAEIAAIAACARIIRM